MPELQEIAARNADFDRFRASHPGLVREWERLLDAGLSRQEIEDRMRPKLSRAPAPHAAYLAALIEARNGRRP